MKYPCPLKNQINQLHPIAVLRDYCFRAADRRNTEVCLHDDSRSDKDAEQEMLIYGKLWWILLIVWDHMNDPHETDFLPSFEEQLLAAFKGDLDDVLTAMYG